MVGGVTSDLSGCFPRCLAYMVARQTSAVSCGAAGMCRLACAYPGDVRRNKNRSRSTKFKVECRRDGTPFYAARPQRHSKRCGSPVAISAAGRSTDRAGRRDLGMPSASIGRSCPPLQIVAQHREKRPKSELKNDPSPDRFFVISVCLRDTRGRTRSSPFRNPAARRRAFRRRSAFLP